MAKYNASTGEMDFGLALDSIKGGRKVARSGWNGNGMWVKLQKPEEGSKISLPYIYMRTVHGDLVPWTASQTDILADDWLEVI